MRVPGRTGTRLEGHEPAGGVDVCIGGPDRVDAHAAGKEFRRTWHRGLRTSAGDFLRRGRRIALRRRTSRRSGMQERQAGESCARVHVHHDGFSGLRIRLHRGKGGARQLLGRFDRQLTGINLVAGQSASAALGT